MAFNFPRILILSLSSTALAFTASMLSANEQAYATTEEPSVEEPSPDTTTSDTPPPPPPSPDELQATIDESSTELSSTTETISQEEAELTETIAQKESDVPTPSEELESAIVEADSLIESAKAEVSFAESNLASAEQAVADYEAAVADTQTALDQEAVAEGEFLVAEEDLASASLDVANQSVVVEEADNNKSIAESELATAEAEASEIVVESFTDENGNFTTSSTDIQILKDGQPVTTEEVDQTSITDQYTSHLDGTTLQLQSPNRETVIDFPNIKQISEIGLTHYAKNGDTTATVDIFDSEGTTTQDTWVLRNGVSSDNPDYTLTETYISPDGYYIDRVVLPADSDWYIVDDIYYKQVTGEVDPQLYTNVETTTTVYKTELNTLQELQIIQSEKLVIRDDKEQVYIDAQINTQQKIEATAIAATTAIDATEAAAASVDSVVTTTTYVAEKVDQVQVQVQSETPPPPAPPVYVAPPPQPEPEPEPEPEEEPTEEPEETEEPLEEDQEEPEQTPETPTETEPDFETEETDSEPEPEPEPPVLEEPTQPTPEEPTPEPEPEPEPQPEEPVEEPTPEPTQEEAQQDLVENISSDNVIESVEQLQEIEDPRTITPEQQQLIKDAAELVFQSAEPNSPEYEAALTALAVVADADDPVINEEIAAIPVLGVAAAQVLETFNDLGNVGADINPEVRKDAQEVVVASVIVTQVAQIASQAAAVTTGAAPGFAAYRRFNK